MRFLSVAQSVVSSTELSDVVGIVEGEYLCVENGCSEFFCCGFVNFFGKLYGAEISQIIFAVVTFSV